MDIAAHWREQKAYPWASSNPKRTERKQPARKETYIDLTRLCGSNPWTQNKIEVSRKLDQIVLKIFKLYEIGTCWECAQEFSAQKLEKTKNTHNQEKWKVILKAALTVTLW